MAQYSFNLEETNHDDSIKLLAFVNSFLFKLFRFLLVVLPVVSFVIYSLNFSDYNILKQGVFFVIVGIFILEEIFRLFVVYKMCSIKSRLDISEIISSQDLNLAQILDFEAANVFYRLSGISKSMQAVIDRNMILSVIVDTLPVRFILNRSGIYGNEVKKVFGERVEKGSSGDIKGKSEKNIVEILSLALKEAKKRNRNFLDVKSIFIVLVETTPELKDIFFQNHLEVDDVRQIVDWYDDIQREYSRKKKYWEKDNLPRLEGIGADWAFAWTTILSRFTEDVSRVISYSNPFNKVWGHDEELKEVERILTLDSKNNVLLIGEPGVGKTAVLYEFGSRVMSGKVNKKIAHKHIVDLRIGLIEAAGKTKAETEALLYQVLNEAHNAGNIILYFENIANILNDEALGTINIAPILLQYLKSPKFQCIATVSPADYNMYVYKNKEIDDSFYKVYVKEPGRDMVIKILQSVLSSMEYGKRSIVTFQALKEMVNLTDRYIKYKPFPEKAIKLLDETLAYVEFNTSHDFVLPGDVNKTLSGQLGFSVGNIDMREKEKLLNLEGFLHQRVIGQERAIAVVSNALRRARVGIGSTKRPIGVYLFLGPTGVGKTETAKALAEAYFGSEKKMVRLDMSEYQSSNSVDKLIGAPVNGKNSQTKGGELTDAVRTNPFTVLLLDELEKADPGVLNLFLQVFEDGRLTDNLGQTVDFTNTIIIATSNAGADFIQGYIREGKNPAGLGQALKDHLFQTRTFTPEFLNRFDSVVQFEPLTQDQIYQIAKLMISAVKKNVYEKGITLEVEDEAIRILAAMGFDPQFGARPMRRVIQEKIENTLAKKMLSGDYQRGDKVIVKKDDIF